jgi:uncharacterized protein YfeS
VETRALYSQENVNNLERSDNGNSSITQKWERTEAAITTAANKITGNNMNKRKNEARQKALQRDIRTRRNIQMMRKEANKICRENAQDLNSMRLKN